jgi:hypothetical protein
MAPKIGCLFWFSQDLQQYNLLVIPGPEVVLRAEQPSAFNAMQWAVTTPLFSRTKRVTSNLPSNRR